MCVCRRCYAAVVGHVGPDLQERAGVGWEQRGVYGGAARKINRGYFALANYVWEFFDDSYATGGAGTQFYPGSTAASTYIVTMLADNDKTAISYPHYYGTTGNQGEHSIWLEDENCAYSGGCTP